MATKLKNVFSSRSLSAQPRSQARDNKSEEHSYELSENFSSA